YVSYWRNVQPPTLPLVVWIVPDETRKQSLEPKITERFGEVAQIFRVITRDEMAGLMVGWLPNRGKLC
ncbi:MAG: hypothetical protein LBH36_02375, partial [Candidatus Nomurabacteria bacterium]|nr:hypothetical protein [Candidatus Nomurabacteria bacterium]